MTPQEEIAKAYEAVVRYEKALEELAAAAKRFNAEVERLKKDKESEPIDCATGKRIDATQLKSTDNIVYRQKNVG